MEIQMYIEGLMMMEAKIKMDQLVSLFCHEQQKLKKDLKEQAEFMR